MKEVDLKFKSTITQEQDSESFQKIAKAQVEELEDGWRLKYLEDNQIPVKILLKKQKQTLIINRGVVPSDYSLIKLELGEKRGCKYVVNNRQMDLISETKFLKVTKYGGRTKVQVEYDLFSGLYLIGNYAVTLIFS
ncbi:DUF1934 domain-containing protein [Lactobacillus mulieris]|uniref:DUF1934 domain-containing protein n=1 Tax=Lactobacillus mulieris TaxID=2508708 RepID=UPI001432EAB4|nr:DUF1934 domain-containing protein [Lactobacillus mulieris]MCF1783304.1 DUF1934 domain-containing protein [Lactobacillus mulieris]MCW8104494.1 DUF1934 domain-containing protein [Lactobacillus mulieris]MDK6802949.1 DUF1934 domain-containing protein [Lactobacillus mulieris]MDK8382065.1 DUF1934 domain-containing protein [Lactobacillus mulieris]MDT9620281.1 DUF1934 domain-containing protein [Lactobacillus mulieris]